MKIVLYSIIAAFCWSASANAQDSDAPAALTASAQSDAPPSATKLLLIRRFMKASGLQARLDTGSFLDKYAFSPGLDWQKNKEKINVEEWLTGPIEALKSTYQKYRPEYQEAFEHHINWEFTEGELSKIVDFLESPVGSHYLDGTWRMNAYTSTNMEETEEALVKEAVAAYQKR